MEVISHSDHDTHSIMGGGKRHAATVNLNSGLITTLSTSLYSDNFLATVRETICNGWDAHKVSGRQDRPLEIELTTTTLIIRDFGPGIPHHKMGEIYLDYGGSTKVADENQTGGFGLGSKSPFSYTDFFNVENNHGGTKGVYTVSRGSSETDGMPDIIEMIKVPTTDEGLTVEIPIGDPRDVAKFTQVITDVIKFGGINAKFNGQIVETIDLEKSPDGVMFTDRKPYIVNGVLYVRYGNVIYPIKEHRDYADLFKQATDIVELSEKRRTRYGRWDDVRQSLIAIFDAKANTLSVVPSREDLHYSARSVKTVKEMLEKFVMSMDPLHGSQHILEAEKKIIAKRIGNAEDLRDLILDKNIIMENYKNNVADKYYGFSGDFYSVDEFTVALAANGHFYTEETLKKAREHRINMVCNHNPTDRDSLKKLREILKTYPTVWDDAHYCRTPTHMRHVNNILSRAAAANLNSVNFHTWVDGMDKGRKTFAGYELTATPDQLRFLVRATRKVVLLVNRKTQVMQYKYQIYQPDNWKLIREDGCMVYIMPNNKKFANYEQTLAFFKRMGYTVIDCVKLDQEAQKRAALLAPKKTPKVVNTSKKPRGQYLVLTNLIDPVTKKFDYRRHLDVDNASLAYMPKPVAVIKPEAIGKKVYNARFFKFGDYCAKAIVNLYGSKIAIAKSSVEYDKAIKGGAIDGYDFIIQDVCKNALLDADYQKYQENRGFWKGFGLMGTVMYDRIRTGTKTGKVLPDIPIVAEKVTDTMKVFKYLELRCYRGCISKDNQKIIEDASTIINNWYDQPLIDPLKGVFANDAEERLRSINLQAIMEKLENPDTGAREKAYNEILLSVALFG